MDEVYLDHAAATPLDDAVFQEMRPYFSEAFHNPSATYLAARRAKAALDDARARVAACLGARPSEIVFTSGGTEANNLAISGVMARFPNSSVTVSAVEHESVLAPAKKYNCFVALVDNQGRVDAADLRQKISDTTVIVSIMYANNEVGTVQPIREIAALISDVKASRRDRSIDLPIYFHVDACQAANYLGLQVASLGVDMMTLNGGKIYGPKQSGALYIASHVQLVPLILGGGQEQGRRSGTENVAGAVGFASALASAQRQRHEEAARLNEVKKHAFRLLDQKIPGAIINGSTKHRLPNNIHLALPGADNERLLIELEGRGFLAAAGSACSASSETPSHVLAAMGLSEDEARSSLRITMGRATGVSEIERLIAALAELVG